MKTGTRSRSATSWRGSRWKTPSRQDGVDGSHAALLQGLQAAAPAVARDPARLAHHAERAGDTAAVLEYAPEAARRAAAAASHREAAQQYARALRFAGGLADRERADLLDLYALEAQLTVEKTEKGGPLLADLCVNTIDILRSVSWPRRCGCFRSLPT